MNARIAMKIMNNQGKYSLHQIRIALPKALKIEYARFKKRLADDGGKWPEYTGPGK